MFKKWTVELRKTFFLAIYRESGETAEQNRQFFCSLLGSPVIIFLFLWVLLLRQQDCAIHLCNQVSMAIPTMPHRIPQLHIDL